MKYLVIGDPHIKVETLSVAEKFFAQVTSLLENDPQIRGVIIVGDIYDSKSFVYGKIQNFFMDQVQKWAKLNRSVFLLAGNHDMLTTECKESLLQPLRCIPGVTVVQNFDDVYSIVDKARAVVLPYAPKTEIKAWLDTHKGSFDVVFGHFGCLGFDMAEGYQDEDGLNPNDYPGVCFILGHYHKPQRCAGAAAVIYVGSPWSHSFGESNQVKNILLWDSSKKGADSIEVMEVEGLPRHISIPWGDYCSNDGLACYDAAYLRVTDIPPEHMAEFSYRAGGAQGVSIPPQQKEARVDESLSVPAMMKSYVESGFLPKEFHEFNDEILKIGLAFYEEVKS